ncbi:hypothetical protein E3P92_02793 [Wallemia ichthyophaga]|uniref:Major facilitator superfamily (MFS) profile domain-containing protein n=1 Tax=Wallemia ichthyophaga TaxID=245174 RepID=A0A4T0EAP7_WALIC|nr:hypothetical protein E3P91_02748 [Wallemia ichthyophaga]TIA80876.1 hypothetical protein E3P98_02415 [Wallemia ichthyophaga]TIA89749.1 hypothetical protein E3P97_02920 [Wallemia ichthyophaga]TIA98313.1 hypothetical protein E3P95_02450 [Wallemia ichthyophaga]TIA99486.1 hypothetical protein E3P94_02569 [Wallemia ichthyophaga]
MNIEENKDFKNELEEHEAAPDTGNGTTVDLETYNNDDDEFGGYENRKKMERKLVFKTDLRMSIMIIIYILNYIDRNNVPAARYQGLQKDLELGVGQRYETVISILYVGYILMQIPSNGLISIINRPSLYIGAAMSIWGTISVLTGITENYVGILMTRFFLGFIEAAFLPGAMFLLSKWYKKNELGVRMTLLYCGNLISNAFGNLIAAGIVNGMEGKLGHRAWRGALTIFVAVCSVFILPDFPETERFLSPLERKLAIRRMAEDAGKVDSVGGKKEVLEGMKMALSDYKVWWLALTLTGMVIGLSFNIYFPTLTKNMGFEGTRALLMCAPPWIFATLVAFPWSVNSDRCQERTFHILVSNLISIAGFIIALATTNQAARYVALFLMTLGYCGFICVYAFTASSFIRPTSRRSVAIAFVNAFSNIGNIAGSYIWDADKFGPDGYRQSYAICLSCTGFSCFAILGFRYILKDINKKIEKLEEEYPGVDPWDVPEKFDRKIDYSLLVKRGFRYML